MYPSWPHPGCSVQVSHWRANWFCKEYDQYDPSTGTEKVDVISLTEAYHDLPLPAESFPFELDFILLIAYIAG